MTATRIMLAAVFTLSLAAPAQALDEEFDRIFGQCLEAWPENPSKKWDCISAGLDRTVEAGDSERYEGLAPREVHEMRVEMLMESIEQYIQRQDFLGSPPLHCSDGAAEGFGTRLACTTQELSIADTAPAQAH